MSEVKSFNVNGINLDISSDVTSINIDANNDDSSANLNIGDDNGNVITQFKNGHIKTQNFDSEEVTDTLKLVELYLSKIYGDDVPITDYTIRDKYKFINGSIQLSDTLSLVQFDADTDYTYLKISYLLVSYNLYGVSFVDSEGNILSEYIYFDSGQESIVNQYFEVPESAVTVYVNSITTALDDLDLRWTNTKTVDSDIEETNLGTVGITISDGRTMTAASAVHLQIDEISGMCYVTCLGHPTSYGEARGHSTLIVFPGTQPFNAECYEYATTGAKMIDWIAQNGGTWSSQYHAMIFTNNIYTDTTIWNDGDYIYSNLTAGIGNPLVVKSNDYFATYEMVAVLPVVCNFECQMTKLDDTYYLLYRNNNGIQFSTTTDFTEYTEVQTISKSVTQRPQAITQNGAVYLIVPTDDNRNSIMGTRSAYHFYKGAGSDYNEYTDKLWITNKFGLVYLSAKFINGRLALCYSTNLLMLGGDKQGKSTAIFCLVKDYYDN